MEVKWGYIRDNDLSIPTKENLNYFLQSENIEYNTISTDLMKELALRDISKMSDWSFVCEDWRDPSILDYFFIRTYCSPEQSDVLEDLGVDGYYQRGDWYVDVISNCYEQFTLDYDIDKILSNFNEFINANIDPTDNKTDEEITDIVEEMFDSLNEYAPRFIIEKGVMFLDIVSTSLFSDLETYNCLDSSVVTINTSVFEEYWEDIFKQVEDILEEYYEEEEEEEEE